MSREPSPVEQFDLETLFACYQSALVTNGDGDGDVELEAFLRGYRQIYILFGSLGRVFAFMSSDVSEKMRIISQLRTSTQQKHYATLKGMLVFEAKQGLAPTKTKRLESGVRAYTRLHRGLAFVAELFASVARCGELEPLGPMARTAYDGTLAPFHPWLIQSGVSLALRTLPNALSLAITLNVVPSDATMVEKEQRDRLRAVAEMVRTIHRVGEKLLGDARCLDLP